MIFWCSQRTALLALNFKAAGHYITKKSFLCPCRRFHFWFFYMVMDNSMSSCVCRDKGASSEKYWKHATCKKNYKHVLRKGDGQLALSDQIQTSLKNTIGRHKQMTGQHTLARQKEGNVMLNVHDNFFPCILNSSLLMLLGLVIFRSFRACSLCGEQKDLLCWLGAHVIHYTFLGCFKDKKKIFKSVKAGFVYSYMYSMTPKFFLFFFGIWVLKIRRILPWFQICGNNWKKAHLEKVLCQTLLQVRVLQGEPPNFRTFFGYNFFVSRFFTFFSTISKSS